MTRGLADGHGREFHRLGGLASRVMAAGGLGPSRSAEQRRERWCIGATRVARRMLDPEGETPARSFDDVTLDLTHAALVAPRFGWAVGELTEAQARTLSDAIVSEAIRQIERGSADAAGHARRAASMSTVDDDAGISLREPVEINLGAVDLVPVHFLWSPQIPRGKVTMLDGEGGTGKGTLCATLAAIVTRGWPFPDRATGIPSGPRCEPSTVIWLSAEDNLEDTLAPRLEAAGADRSRVIALRGKRDTTTGQLTEITLADMDVLTQALEHHRPALVIVDPIQAYLGAAVDMHRSNEVRPILTRLGQLAERFDCAIVCIRHLNKAVGQKAAHRGMGTVDFFNFARSTLLVGHDPNDEQRRGLVHYKSSTEAKAPTIGFALVPAEVRNAKGEICRVGRLEWTGLSDLTKESILAAPSTPDPGTDKQTLAAKARLFLQTALAEGPRALQDLIKEAASDKLEEHHLMRASKSLKIVSRTAPGSFPRRTIWSLPRPRHLAPVLTLPYHKNTVSTVSTVSTTAPEKGSDDNSSDSTDTTTDLFADGVRGEKVVPRRPGRGDRREGPAAFRQQPTAEQCRLCGGELTLTSLGTPCCRICGTLQPAT